MSYLDESENRLADGGAAARGFGLTGNALKIIGIVLMVFDHVHQMFHPQGVPMLFTWIGRLCAPIFIFMCAEGFYYTRSKWRYLLQLYIGELVMRILTYRVFVRFMEIDDVELINNVFAMLLMCGLYMLLFDRLRAGIRERDLKKLLGAVGLMVLPVVLDIFAISAIVPVIPYGPLFVEGGPTFVALGLLFYIFRDKRFVQVICLVALAVLSAVSGLVAGQGLFDGAAQWLMGLTAILIWFYNGRRGGGSKWFFYIFYPAHIYGLYTLAWWLSTR